MVCLGNICINTLHEGDDDDDDNNNNNNNNNNRIKMASHTMQLAGKRKILQILQETNNSTPRKQKHQ
jgi:hypothetical protein